MLLKGEVGIIIILDAEVGLQLHSHQLSEGNSFDFSAGVFDGLEHRRVARGNWFQPTLGSRQFSYINLATVSARLTRQPKTTYYLLCYYMLRNVTKRQLQNTWTWTVLKVALSQIRSRLKIYQVTSPPVRRIFFFVDTRFWLDRSPLGRGSQVLVSEYQKWL